ncbi:CoA transferase [Caenimonas koreensis DSM 17982]|uniref:CoA transferase n=1 Tax=Caenimonas koreensis DSM 17982 TaxID=1121255 RepID=A0A844B8Y3_9BURK|nr:CoA transferase [Caenimonas koreensis]ART90248.1 CAIB/BAIF family protein [uncultured bacterium]MRD49602.1 CoA transferase [Caenimonas koreensis DSM 17982]
MNTSHLPLSGMVVIEFGHSVAAPFAGQILGDLGAEVIKVEKPEGDDARKWGPPFVDGAAAMFQSLNRNKQSIVCGLRDPADQERLLSLIDCRADVVLQNLRPGQADAVGFGARALLARKPSLVYCNLGAFGATGPLKNHPGYDPLMQAFSGIMSAVGEEGWPSVRVGPSIVDMGTGMWAVIGIVSALLRRKESGVGGMVDVSLFETAASWMTMLAAQYLAAGEVPRKCGSGQVGIVPYRAYCTADGELVVAAGNNKLFAALSQVLGHPQWITDERFVSNPDRVRNAPALYEMIEAAMARRTNSEWTVLLDAAGVPCAPVQNVKQMLEHPQMQALGLAQSVPGATIQMVGLPISFDGLRPQTRSAAPALGAHTDVLLSAAAGSSVETQ